MNTELELLSVHLRSANSPEAVFGSLTGDAGAMLSQLKSAHHKLAKAVHPDKHGSAKDKALAAELFIKLNEWRDIAEAKINGGSYGDRKVYTGPLKQPQGRVTLTTKKRVYVLDSAFTSRGIYNVYPGEYQEADKVLPVFVCVTVDVQDNGFARNEATVLKLLANGALNEQYKPYVTELLDSFVLHDGAVNRQVNVVPRIHGWSTLAEVHDKYPHGIDPKDMAWMFRRLLVAIGFGHVNGVIHGAVLPENVSILPDQHGLMLHNWSYSLGPDAVGGHIVAVSNDFDAWYPPAVFDKKPASAGFDIYMASKSMIWLLGGDPKTSTIPDSVPSPIKAFLRGCTLTNEYQQPDDAWKIKSEFDDLLQQLWGDRKFHPFSMK